MANGTFHSFVALPASVPEPTSLLLLASGLLGIGALAPWRKSV
jgi:hypothetical protein